MTWAPKNNKPPVYPHGRPNNQVTQTQQPVLVPTPTNNGREFTVVTPGKRDIVTLLFGSSQPLQPQNRVNNNVYNK